MEWYSADDLMVTPIWLYLLILRPLAGAASQQEIFDRVVSDAVRRAPRP
jgi:hypothetical protein